MLQKQQQQKKKNKKKKKKKKKKKLKNYNHEAEPFRGTKWRREEGIKWHNNCILWNNQRTNKEELQQRNRLGILNRNKRQKDCLWKQRTHYR